MEAWVVCVSSQMKIGSDKEDYHQIKLQIDFCGSDIDDF